MKLNKILNALYKAVLSILLVLVAYVTYCSIFNIFKSTVEINPVIIILGIIVTIGVFIGIKKIIDKISEKKANIIAVICIILFFVSLSIFGNKLTAISTYDLSNIIREAKLMLQNGGKFVTEDYFSVYSNQVPLTILIYYIFKIGSILNINDLKAFAIIINSLFIAITAFFTYLSVKRLSNYKYALMTLLFFIVNPAFYLYSSYFYADTLCMPFAAIAMYFYIVLKDEKKKKKKIWIGILAGLILGIGYKIRVVLAIMLVAMIIDIIISKQNKKTIGIMTIIIGFIVSICLCHILEARTEPKINKDLKFPVTHWIMMGFNYKNQGRYSAQDFNYTKNSGENKIQNNKLKIKERINNLGPIGLIQFMGTKLAVNWSNGGYDYISKLLNTQNADTLYKYFVGNKRVFVTYYYQICKATILFTLCIAIISQLRKKDNMNNKQSFIYISIFGAFIFYLIWEVLTRYSLTFLPWMMLLFGVGINQIEKLFEKEKTSFKLFKKEININTKTTKNIISVATITITLVFIIINYNNYCLDTEMYWDKRVMQWSNEQKQVVPKIANNIVKQTFKASKPFNQICVMFYNKDTTGQTHYKFVLRNSKGKKLAKEKFTSDSVLDEKIKIFSFKKIKPKNEETYTIEIYSSDATEDNSIGIATYYLEGYDVYPNGNILINNEEIQADFAFQVNNVTIRNYVSKKVYIALSLIIIMLELFAFYPKMRYNRKA